MTEPLYFSISSESVSNHNYMSSPRSVKIHLRKKRRESKLHRKYVLNLLNEPQHLAEIETPKLLQIPNKE